MRRRFGSFRRRFGGFRRRFRGYRGRVRRRFRSYGSRKLRIFGIRLPLPAVIFGLPALPILLVAAYFFIRPFKNFVDTKILHRS